MSDNNDQNDKGKITAEIKTKVKDPKRVEAGKKLALLSKAAREKKKAMTEIIPGNWNYSLVVLGTVIAMASLVIAYKSYNLTVGKKSKPKNEPVVVEPSASVSNLENL